jgi:hypothetical protein
VSAPIANSSIAVTTFNSTQRQYLNTQSGLTGVTVANIVNVDNLITSLQPAVRVTTGINHNLIGGSTPIKIDGVLGSTQLNNQTFYVNIISPTVFDLYSLPYSALPGAINYPITQCNSYLSGGYVWEEGLFVVATTQANQTSSIDNTISVTSTSGLVEGTPIYFSQDLAELVAGTEYFIKTITRVTKFTVS